MKLFSSFLLLLTLLSIGASTETGRIEIRFAPELTNWFYKQNERDLQTEILPFGHVPWGRKIRAGLFLSTPSDACGPITFRYRLSGNYIILTSRDGCDLHVKAKNAELAGARMLMVIDNSDSNRFDSIKVPSGSIEPINIPSIMVTKVLGDRLMEHLAQHDSFGSPLALYYDFSMTKRGFITYNLVISSSNRESFNFLKQWKPYHNLLKDKSTIQPTYAYSQMGDLPSTECLCNSYCAPPEYKNLPLSGADAMMEDLRQICILSKSKDTWWQYVLAYAEFCLDQVDVKDCSSQIMKGLGLNEEEIEACVTGSFEDSNGVCKNLIFDNTKFPNDEYSASMGLKYNNIPTLSMHGSREIKNVFPASGIFEAFCESYPEFYNEKPSVCTGAYYDTTSPNPDLNQLTLPPPEPPSGLHIDLSSKPSPQPEPLVKPEPTPESTSIPKPAPEPQPQPNSKPDLPEQQEPQPYHDPQPEPRPEPPAAASPETQENPQGNDGGTKPKPPQVPDGEHVHESEPEKSTEEGTASKSKEIVVQETSNSIGFGIVVLLVLAVLVGFFFWRRHTKRNQYRSLDTEMNSI